MESRLAYLCWELSYPLATAIMTLGFSLRTDGRNHIPRSGPVLIIANHQSFLDPILVGLVTRRHLRYLARKSLFRNPLFRWLIESYGAVPIDQEGIGKEGIRIVLERLGQGDAIVVFPEGTRTEDGALQTLRPGIHLLIKRTSVPIVPVGIAGAFHALPFWQKFPTLSPLFLPPNNATIAVCAGKPLDGRRLVDMPREQVLEELFTAMKEVTGRAEHLRRK
jgi:1-acyl-sn-glycerol-3-phosphate acyltransferase